MKKILFLQTVAIALFISSCVDLTPSIKPGSGDTCIQCPTNPDNPPTTPPSTPVTPPDPTCADNGKKAGIADATMIFKSTFMDVPCPQPPNTHKPPSMDPPAFPVATPPKPGTEIKPVAGSDKCFISTPEGRDQFSYFILGYRENLSALIAKETDPCSKAFYESQLAEFNKKLDEYSINYGVPIPS